MDIVLESLKVKLSLDDKLFNTISNIILNENIADKKEYFKIYLDLIKSQKITPQIVICSLLVYVLDIHKDFKNELMIFIKKNVASLKEYFESFFSIVDLSLISNKDISQLKTKIFLINNLYDYYKKTLCKEELEPHANNTIMNLFLNEYYNFFTKGDYCYLTSNYNQQIDLILSATFNYFGNLVKSLDNKSDMVKIKINEIKDIAIKEMIEKTVCYKKLFKDYHFTLSNVIFHLFKEEHNDNLGNFVTSSFGFLKNFVNDYEMILIYIKSFLNNISLNKEEDYDILINMKFECLNILYDKGIIAEGKEKFIMKGHTIIDYYTLFLETNWYTNYSILLNDIFIFFLQKTNKNLKQLILLIESHGLISKFFNKLKQEKDNYGFIEDNFFNIIEEIITIDKQYTPLISSEVEAYFKQLINGHNKTLNNECRLFNFLSPDSFTIRKEYLDYLLSISFEKRYIQHICEYSKMFFDYCFRIKKDQNIFQDNYPAPFINYLKRIHLQDLKWFNNLLVNFEKSNTIYLQLLINYSYSIDKTNYPILLTLLKPYRTHRKFLFAKDKAIHCENPDLNINIVLPISNFKDIAKSNDYSLVLLTIEFLNEFDDVNEIYPIIKTILKYNMKSSYIEYKSGMMKTLGVYFNFYFNKIGKMSNKAKKSKEEEEYIKVGLSNLIYTLKYLADNIYDRPVENLLSYIEMTKLLMDNSDKMIIQVTKTNNAMTSFEKDYKEAIFNKGLCSSLIGLLKHSWYFVRVNTFEVLKHQNYTIIIKGMENALLQEIDKNVFSLRQMDAEGSAYLFLIMIHHLKSEFLEKFLLQEYNYQMEESFKKECSKGSLLTKSIEMIQKLIVERTPAYLKILSNPNDESTFIVKSKSIHSFYILIQIILSLEKNTFAIDGKLSYETINLLMSVSSTILSLNSEFIKYLINNGVSEFSTENIEEDDTYNDNEDKRLISLWCTSKYSLATLSSIFDLLSHHYQSLNTMETVEQLILKPIQRFLYEMIKLLLLSKHMGVVHCISECLYKAAVLLNKSPEKYKSYRDIPHEQIKKFIEQQLIKEEVSSTLRRSAGIPFLMTSLIRSYISQHFSNQKVMEILDFTMKSLLDCYSKYQFSYPDVSVHSLHIIRAVSDDTQIKPFIREFNDLIIVRIIDGLQSENWSIKNACMLMLSRVIKNNFLLANDARTLPTVVKYFSLNVSFLKQIKEIIVKNLEGIEINDCLLLFITLFTKFRESKPSEYNNPDLNELLEMFMKLGKKNNKLFKKLLATAIEKMIGGNNTRLIDLINNHISTIDVSTVEGNNQYDFYYNLIVDLIEKEPIESSKIVAKCIKLVKDSNRKDNYFVKTKLIQLLKKIKQKTNDDIKSMINDCIVFQEIGIDETKKQIDMTILFEQLIKNSRIFSFNRFIKHSLDMYLGFEYELVNFNLITVFAKSKAEEIIVYLFKNYSKQLSTILPIDSLVNDITTNDLLSIISVNISSRICAYLLNNIKLIPTESCNKLIISLITLTNVEKDKSKLITRLLPLVGSLIKYYPSTLNKETITTFSNTILDFSYGHNTEKIRIAAIQCLDKIIQSDTKISINSTIILKTLFFFLNDENPDIRNYACKVYQSFNEEMNKAFLKKNNGLLFYTNEFLIKKLLKTNINNLSNNEKMKTEYIDFVIYLMKENLYFNNNKASMNNDTKVFYFEPDNRYVDNVENKILISKTVVKTLTDKNIIYHEKFDEKESSSLFPMPYFISIEQFTIFTTKYLFENISKLPQEKTQFLFSYMRNSLYETKN